SGGTGVIHYERSCDSDGHGQGVGPEDGVLSAKRESDRGDRQAGAGQSVSSCCCRTRLAAVSGWWNHEPPQLKPHVGPIHLARSSVRRPADTQSWLATRVGSRET